MCPKNERFWDRYPISEGRCHATNAYFKRNRTGAVRKAAGLRCLSAEEIFRVYRRPARNGVDLP